MANVVSWLLQVRVLLETFIYVDMPLLLASSGTDNCGSQLGQRPGHQWLMFGWLAVGSLSQHEYGTVII